MLIRTPLLLALSEPAGWSIAMGAISALGVVIACLVSRAHAIEHRERTARERIASEASEARDLRETDRLRLRTAAETANANRPKEIFCPRCGCVATTEKPKGGAK